MLRIAVLACAMIVRRRHSIVTLLISSRLVRPALTFSRPGAAQVPDAFLGGLVGDVDGVAAGHDDAADRLGDFHDLVDADAALVAVGAAARSPSGA